MLHMRDAHTFGFHSEQAIMSRKDDIKLWMPSIPLSSSLTEYLSGANMDACALCPGEYLVDWFCCLSAAHTYIHPGLYRLIGLR
jgi:hypothetical protein